MTLLKTSPEQKSCFFPRKRRLLLSLGNLLQKFFSCLLDLQGLPSLGPSFIASLALPRSPPLTSQSRVTPLGLGGYPGHLECLCPEHDVHGLQATVSKSASALLHVIKPANVPTLFWCSSCVKGSHPLLFQRKGSKVSTEICSLFPKGKGNMCPILDLRVKNSLLWVE